jgi:hypothetical protein
MRLRAREKEENEQNWGVNIYIYTEFITVKLIENYEALNVSWQ